jgi:hypothetical protein
MKALSEELEGAHRKYPPNAEDVGGVLFGVRDGPKIRVTAARAVPCSLVRGPGSEFTGADESTFEHVIRRAAADPELKPLGVVGWYRSRARTAIVSGEKDAQLFNRYFPLQWHVELVLDAAKGQPPRGGLVFQPGRGASKANWEVLRRNEAEQPEPEFEFDSIDEPDGPSFVGPKVGRRNQVLWGALAVAVAIGIVASGFLPEKPTDAPRSESGVSFQLLKEGSQLHAIWNASSPAIKQATKGTLLVNDGGIVSNFDLGPALLRSGAWPIVHRFPEVFVRLKLEVPGIGEVVELARYDQTKELPSAASEGQPSNVTSPQRDVPASASQPSGTLTPPRSIGSAESPRLGRQGLEAPPTPALDWRKTLSNTDPTKAAQARPPVPSPPARTASQQTPSSSPASAAAASSINSPPIAVEPVRVTLSRSTTGAASSSGTSAGPRTGRLIWTGHLPAGGSVTIGGNRASGGTINGQLPSAPLRVLAHPADLSSRGLAVYTSQQRHAAGAVVEQGSARNGWLETRYIFDENRAATVSVVEAPGAANGFKLILRGGQRPTSVVVVDWELIEAPPRLP